MIPHNRPTMGLEEIEAASKVISSASLSQGKEVEAFENELCHYLGYDDGHAVAVSSGSAALYMAIRAINYKQKIETIAIPAYSCSALKNAVSLASKKPLYEDASPNSPNINSKQVQKKDADAIIACHLFGMPSAITNENIIEDCAQAIGATINGQKVGTQTNISVFSFYATKPITSGGEGGMVVSKEKDIIDFIKDLRDFDMKNDEAERFNFQMTDLQAAIGRVQLKKIDHFIEMRKKIADRYQSHSIPLWNRYPGCMDYRGLVESKDPAKLVEYLKIKGIKAIIPIEERELLSHTDVPNALKLTHTLVSIPLYPSLTDAEQDIIINELTNYMYKEGEL